MILLFESLRHVQFNHSVEPSKHLSRGRPVVDFLLDPHFKTVNFNFVDLCYILYSILCSSGSLDYWLIIIQSQGLP